jgi:hypothetical protein
VNLTSDVKLNLAQTMPCWDSTNHPREILAPTPTLHDRVSRGKMCRIISKDEEKWKS